MPSAKMSLVALQTAISARTSSVWALEVAFLRTWEPLAMSIKQISEIWDNQDPQLTGSKLVIVLCLADVVLQITGTADDE